MFYTVIIGVLILLEGWVGMHGLSSQLYFRFGNINAHAYTKIILNPHINCLFSLSTIRWRKSNFSGSLESLSEATILLLQSINQLQVRSAELGGIIVLQSINQLKLPVFWILLIFDVDPDPQVHFREKWIKSGSGSVDPLPG